MKFRLPSRSIIVSPAVCYRIFFLFSLYNVYAPSYEKRFHAGIYLLKFLKQGIHFVISFSFGRAGISLVRGNARRASGVVTATGCVPSRKDRSSRRNR